MICARNKVSSLTNQLRVAVVVSQLRMFEGCSSSLLTTAAVLFLLSFASYVIVIATIAAPGAGTLHRDHSCRPLKLLRHSRFQGDPPRSTPPHVPPDQANICLATVAQSKPSLRPHCLLTSAYKALRKSPTLLPYPRLDQSCTVEVAAQAYIHAVPADTSLPDSKVSGSGRVLP